MAYRRGLFSILSTTGLLACGAIGAAAVWKGFWGLLAGTILVAIWLGGVHWCSIDRPRRRSFPDKASSDVGQAIVLRMLLDAAPTPLLEVEGGTARAINRAARRHFATDDRILPVAAGLLDRSATHLRHEGRSWRIDRVEARDAGPERMVVALIDIEQEERAAEVRATAELIQVLGHELLNGLAPIVSLAESGLAAVNMAEGDPVLLSEILGTLARRADSLQRFTEAYRTLARLPEPTLRSTSISELAEDLARLFAGRWPSVPLSVEVPAGSSWSLDRDQISQAIWALLQNAAESALANSDRPAHVFLSGYVTATGLAIEVRDNGDGVPPATADLIFRPFHTTKPNGTGIGLSLARQIAHTHGGALTLQISPMTTFRLFVPKLLDLPVATKPPALTDERRGSDRAGRWLDRS